jgi:2,4'-dihydroxyacetophenone dioxygenase
MLEVLDDVEEMVTMFHVTGAYIYLDVDGNTVGVEDVFSKIQKAREHYEAIGRGADYVNQYVRWINMHGTKTETRETLHRVNR